MAIVPESVHPAHVLTGIPGLDQILDGGLTADRLYLVEGVPGSGKTTLSLQFLLAGVARGETVLFVSLSETEEELREVSASHGWSLEGIHIHELDAHHARGSDADYTMFHPSEVELGETTQRILKEVERLRPTRVVFDSLAELRLLAGSVLRFRRQVLALKQYFAGRDCTVLMLDESQVSDQGLHVHTLVHGAISLDQLRPEFGGDRRRLRIGKMRGRNFISGYHDYRIITGGIEVYPRLVAAQHRRIGEMRPISSGVAALDALIGGGLDNGTSTLVIGAAGTGKSTLATQFAIASAQRGEPVVFFIFDESQRAFITRARGLGFPIDAYLADGSIRVQSIDPAELTPGEFVHAIRQATEVDGMRMVVIDSLNGYLNAMPGERYMLVQLHELLTYLGQLGVTSLLIAAQAGLIGQTANPVDVSYLADSVVLLRYFESEGEVRKAISVLKKRTGFHEPSIRELRMHEGSGLSVSEPLRRFRGVLTGVPFDEPGQLGA